MFKLTQNSMKWLGQFALFALVVLDAAADQAHGGGKGARNAEGGKPRIPPKHGERATLASVGGRMASIIWNGTEVTDFAQCVKDECGEDKIKSYLDIIRGSQQKQKLQGAKNITAAMGQRGIKELFECIRGLKDTKPSCYEEIFDRQCEVALQVMKESHNCDLLTEANVNAATCPSGCNRMVLRMLKPCASAPSRFNATTPDLYASRKDSVSGPKGFWLLANATLNKTVGSCDCDKGMQKERGFDGDELADELAELFPACALNLTHALEEHPVEYDGITECLNNTCLAEARVLLNDSSAMMTQENREKLAQELDHVTDDTAEDVVEKMRKSPKHAAMLLCLEKSARCSSAARDMKCGMAIKQGRNKQKEDIMMKIKRGMEMAHCAAGSFSAGAKRGRAPDMSSNHSKMRSPEFFAAENASCPFNDTDIYPLRHCIGANVGRDKQGPMSVLKDLVNEDGVFSREALLDKVPLCSKPLDSAFSYADDADFKMCFDMNCGHIKGQQSWGRDKIEDEIERINVTRDIPDVREAVERSEKLRKIIGGSGGCLVNTTNTTLRSKCALAKKGLECHMGQRMARAKGCDFDNAFERPKKSDLEVSRGDGARGSSSGSDQASMRNGTPNSLKPMAGGRGGFGMKSTCPVGCDESAFRFIKVCVDAPRSALSGRGGMERLGDLSGDGSDECKDMDVEGMRPSIQERVEEKAGIKSGMQGREQDQQRQPGGGRKPNNLGRNPHKVQKKPEREEQFNQKPGSFGKARDWDEMANGLDESRSDFQGMLREMESRSIFSAMSGFCDEIVYKRKRMEMSNKLLAFQRGKMELGAAKRGEEACTPRDHASAKRAFSSTGSCAQEVLNGMRDRGFDKVRLDLERGAKANMTECKDLKDRNLSIALNEHQEMKKRNESFRSTGSANGEVSTRAKKAAKEGGRDGAPGTRELFKCAEAVAPAKVKPLKCELAFEAMKTRYNCDLRGEAGLTAAFGGNRAKNLAHGEDQSAQGRGYGMNKKLESTCDRPDRMKAKAQERGDACPCVIEAFKELAECIGVKRGEIFENSCDAKDDAITKEKLALEYPNCKDQITAALKARMPKAKLRGKLTLSVNDKVAFVANDARGQKIRAAIGRAIARMIDGVEAEDVYVSGIEDEGTRRLKAKERLLASGDVGVAFEIIIPEGSSLEASAVQTKIAEMDEAQLKSHLTTELQEEDVEGVSVTTVADVSTLSEDSPGSDASRASPVGLRGLSTGQRAILFVGTLLWPLTHHLGITH